VTGDRERKKEGEGETADGETPRQGANIESLPVFVISCIANEVPNDFFNSIFAYGRP